MFPTFVPMTDPHLAASLKVGAIAAVVYEVSKQSDLLGFSEDVQDDLRTAHAALNHAACTLMDVAIRNNDTERALNQYKALAVKALTDAIGGAA